MLKQIRKLWSDGSIMLDAVDRLRQMVSDGQYVYTHAWEIGTGHAVADKLAEPIREHDKAVNRGERRIRRMIVEHLSINPGQDVAGCMAVMLMAKDIERIGDHARNIYGVLAGLDTPVTKFRLFDKLDAVQKAVGALLPKLERAVTESDEGEANEILAMYQENKKLLKELQATVFQTEMPTSEAVPATLLMRYFTRVNAHIGNAASGVIFPIENIDFVSRGQKEQL